MPGGGRDPVAISGSVNMKEAKGVPSAKPDKGAVRRLGKARRAFLALRERLRQFAEVRRSATLKADHPALLDEDARALSELGWGGLPIRRRAPAGRAEDQPEADRPATPDRRPWPR